jgi:hypothetical protein
MHTQSRHIQINRIYSDSITAGKILCPYFRQIYSANCITTLLLYTYYFTYWSVSSPHIYKYGQITSILMWTDSSSPHGIGIVNCYSRKRDVVWKTVPDKGDSPFVWNVWELLPGYRKSRVVCMWNILPFLIL